MNLRLNIIYFSNNIYHIHLQTFPSPLYPPTTPLSHFFNKTSVLRDAKVYTFFHYTNKTFNLSLPYRRLHSWHSYNITYVLSARIRPAVGRGRRCRKNASIFSSIFPSDCQRNSFFGQPRSSTGGRESARARFFPSRWFYSAKLFLAVNLPFSGIIASFLISKKYFSPERERGRNGRAQKVVANIAVSWNF